MGVADENARSSEDRLWTPANIVTMIRICLVPLFVVALISPWPEWFGLDWFPNSDKSIVAAGIFIVISCTDWLDGYLARSRGEVTTFGKFMDPLADKILVTAALLALIELGVLPSWVVLVIIAREFIVSGVRMVAASEGVVIAASYYGKFKTVFQMIAVVMFTVKDSHMVGTAGQAFSDVLWLASWAVMLVALALTVISMIDYVAKARFLLGFGKAPQGQAGEAKDAHGDAAPIVADGRSCSAQDEEEDILAAAKAVVADAVRCGVTVGTAESLTGGLIAAALTEVPGSSAVVRGGIVSYATEVKSSLLGVSSSVLDEAGVVSVDVARAMAEGAKMRLGCDVAIAVTGIAGPGGAEPGKPVGTVCMAVATPSGTESFEYCFVGNRQEVREQTVLAGLDCIRNALAACSS